MEYWREKISHNTVDVVAIAHTVVVLLNGMLCLDGGVKCGVVYVHRQ
jgi:hypothetical protein